MMDFKRLPKAGRNGDGYAAPMLSAAVSVLCVLGVLSMLLGGHERWGLYSAALMLPSFKNLGSTGEKDSSAGDAGSGGDFGKAGLDFLSYGETGEDESDAQDHVERESASHGGIIESVTVIKPGESGSNGDVKPLRELTMRGTSVTWYEKYGGIYVNNQTDYKLNIEKLLSEKPPIDTGKLTLLIVHTHTTESYNPGSGYALLSGSRSDDPEQNVIRIGREVKAELERLGYNVIHDETVHDTSFYKSYSRALETIEQRLAENPDIQVVIDIHRDYMEREDYIIAPVAERDGEKAAQLMLVMGTNASGLKFDGWRDNLRFGLRIQESLERIWPGIARPLYLVTSRYNEHATPGSILVEVGSSANTLEQAIAAAKILAQAIAETLDGLK